MKALIMCFKDADPGATANDLTILAEVVFAGTEAEVPGRVRTSFGPNGNGVPITISFGAIAQYPNNCEDALIAEATRLGLPANGGTLARTDCFFPSYTRGA
jgi:hypothetical protein